MSWVTELAVVASVSVIAGGGAIAAPAPTFTRDVAPLLHRQCVSCHSEGQSAPFPLVTYQDVRPRARLIVRVTRDGLMPPWQPDAGHGEFDGERRLTREDIDMLARWERSGAREGPPRDSLTSPPAVPSGLGEPDLVLWLPEPYSIPASGADQIRTFVIPTSLNRPRRVRALMFEPGPTAAVHHANIKVDTQQSSRWQDEEDPGPGYEGAGGRGARFPDGHFLGWTHGQSPRHTEDAPWLLEPGADVVLELHLTPTGKAEVVRPVLHLYFTDTEPTLVPYMIRIGRQDIDIPAGADAYWTVDRYTLPVGVRVLAVQPHAHSLARELHGFATLPDGSQRPLIRISRWDPRWQDVYRYRAPVTLPPGSILTITYRFDNSQANRRNPSSPPRRVTFGQSAAAEMGDLWLQVMTATADERQTLDRHFAPKMLRDDIAGAEQVLAAAPADPRAHTDVALCYAAAGRWQDALAHLERAVALAPSSVGARYEFGTALLRQRRFDEARAQLLEAVRLTPNLAAGLANLGAVEHASGRLRDAVAWYERALALQPSDAATEYNLGRAHASLGAIGAAIEHYQKSLVLAPSDAITLSSLAAQLALAGDTEAAVKAYRRALEHRPEFLPALVDLAWLLATSDPPHQRPADAITLALRASTTSGGAAAVVLDTLAVAYASAGQYEEALRVGREALQRARADGDGQLAERIAVRMRYYESKLVR